MTKESLKQLFDLMNKLDRTVDKCSELGLDFVETPFYEIPGFLYDMVLESNYTEQGQDWINWWFFEKRGHPELKVYNADGSEIQCETFDDLYEVVKQFEK